MEKKKVVYRQGDITLIPEEAVPETAYLNRYRYGVIAEGEETGHRHWVDETKTEFYEDLSGDQYVVVIEDVVLAHTGPDQKPAWTKQEAQERGVHIAQNIPRGVYRVGREQEHDPVTDQTWIATD